MKVKEMIDSTARQDPGNIQKLGLNTGRFAIHPFNGARVPIWIGNFVLMGYGTGAIMAVPAHDKRDFEFCTEYKIPIVAVVEPADGSTAELPYGDYGVVRNSGEWSGLLSRGGSQENGCFRQREWLRRSEHYLPHQRLGHLAAALLGHTHSDGGIAPSAALFRSKRADLPVVLPLDIKITGKGRSPLECVESFINVACPQCGGPGRRESDTMDTFIDSSWYFYRYCDASNDKAPFDSQLIAKWFPIDQYIGGVRACHSAPDLFALLDEGHARHRRHSER